MKTIFRTQDQDDKQPIVETHYYKWLLEKQPKDIHSIHTKMEYLESQGFIILNNSISSVDAQRLKIIEEHYFDREIKPNLKFNIPLTHS
jgi:hypothetical protein